MKNNGFTLAEVLITLGIIGVVAAMTIPTLLNKTNDAELKTKWKKEYSVMSQAALQLANDNGGSLIGVLNNSATSNNTRDAFEPYLHYIKECDAGSSFGNCWEGSAKGLNGNVIADASNWNDQAGLILSDGASISFQGATPTWASCSVDVGSGNPLLICGYVPVDVNGPKKGPNVVGKDIFSFWILPNGTILPEGCSQDGRDNCNTSGTGTSCSAKYLFGK